jgi:hypothetical protein
MQTKEVVAWLSEFPVEGTRATYSLTLYRYWNGSLSKKHRTLSDWITEVERQWKSDDMMTRKSVSPHAVVPFPGSPLGKNLR